MRNPLKSLADDRAVPPCILVVLRGETVAASGVAAAEALAGVDRGVVHVLHVPASGAPVAAVLAAAQRHNAEILVLPVEPPVASDRGADPFSEALLESLTIPVVLLRPGWRPDGWDPRHVLLPLDGSPDSTHAIDPAAAFARRRGGSLVLLHVTGPLVEPAEEPGSLGAPVYTDQPQHEWPAWYHEFLARGAGTHPTVPARDVRLRMVAGVPGFEIVQYAARERIDLIVLDWHGRMGPGQGRTVRAVLRDAPCPVMVTRV